MQVINFSFDSSVPKQRRPEVLDEIASWPEVSTARQLDPKAEDADVARLGYAYLNPGHAPDALIRRLRAMPEIATASEPATRGLV
jgi:hypothetical protein